MDIKSFRNKYGLELIPVALETLTTGKCVWDSGIFGKPQMAKSGMPDYIFLAFANEGIITKTQMNSYVKTLRKQPMVEAAFAQLQIEFDIDEALDLDIGSRMNMGGDFDMTSIRKFSFTNSKGREMPLGVKNELNSLLDELKEKHWDEYKSKLRKAFIITELYYGDLSITINNELQANLEASLPAAELQAANKLKLGRTITYTFSNTKVPFAMRIERIKHF